MKKLLALLLVSALTVCLAACGDTGADTKNASAPSSADAGEISARESGLVPVVVRYERTPANAAPRKAKTGEQYMIDAVLEALDALTVKEPVTVDAGKTADVIILTDADGNEERIEFRDGALLKDGTYYRTEGYEQVKAALDGLMQGFGGYDYPTAFTATPFRDDRDGLYWIFYNGYGARFTGFDGEWFTGEQLFTWGADNGELYVYPAGGEKELYPVSYGGNVDDDNIYLGDLTLTETYPSELEPLYVRWTPVGDQIKEKLSVED